MVGKEFFVLGTEVMVDVVAERRGREVNRVEPLEEGGAFRWWEVEDG